MAVARRTTHTGIAHSLLLLTVSLPLLLFNHGSQSLIGSDEGYYAQMAREMVVSGQWLAPTFLGDPYFEKPPLNQWLIAGSYTLFGVSEWSARLPGILAALLGVQLVYWIGRHQLGQRPALLGGLVLATAYLWVHDGRTAAQDVPLACLGLVGIGSLLAAERRPLFALGWGLSLGAGVLLKSAAGLLAAIAVLPFLVFANRHHRLLHNPWLYLGLGLGGASFGLWYWLATRTWGPLVYEGLFGTLGMLTRRDFHAVGPWYYLWNFPVNFFPWALFSLAGFVLLLRGDRERFLLVWSYPLVLFGLLNLFTTKTPYYLLQVMPFAALLAGVAFEHLWKRAQSNRALHGWISGLGGALGALLLVAGIALLVQPRLLPNAVVYAPVAIGLGTGWVMMGLLFWQRRWLPRWVPWWMGTLVGGPWLALAAAGLWAGLGDYNPGLKAFAARFPPHSPIDLVYEKTPARVSDYITLAFYTPMPGVSLTARQVRGTTTYLVLSPESALLRRDSWPFEVVADYEGWLLVRRHRMQPAIQPPAP